MQLYLDRWAEPTVAYLVPWGADLGESSGLTWSLNTSAVAFSAFSGVLAAFMFAAVVLLLNRELRRQDSSGRFQSSIGDEVKHPIAFMFGAFFSLVVAAFLFAVMTGNSRLSPDPKVPAREFFEGTMPCLALSLGVVQMAVALTWLLEARGVSGTPLHLARRIVDLTIVITALFLTGVLISPWFQQPVSPWIASITPLNAALVWLGLTFVLGLSIPLGRLSRGWIRGHLTGDEVDRYVNLGLIFVAAVAAAVSALLSAAPDISWIYGSPWGNLLVLASTVLICIAFSALEIGTPQNYKRPWGLSPSPSLGQSRGPRRLRLPNRRN